MHSSGINPDSELVAISGLAVDAIVERYHSCGKWPGPGGGGGCVWRLVTLASKLESPVDRHALLISGPKSAAKI